MSTAGAFAQDGRQTGSRIGRGVRGEGKRSTRHGPISALPGCGIALRLGLPDTVAAPAVEEGRYLHFGIVNYSVYDYIVIYT